MKKLLMIYLIAVSLIINVTGESPAKAADNLFTDDEISGEINIHCWDAVKYIVDLEYAARLFEQKYPGTKVNATEFSLLPNDRSSSMYNLDNLNKNVSDYVTLINVEMMSGQGADIYAIDVLPVHKYADSGQFVDLRGFMDNDPDFNYDDYHKNIFDAMLYRGGQYIMPADYILRILCYDTNLMNDSGKSNFNSIGKYTYNQLFDIAADSFLMYNSAEQPIRTMLTSGGYSMFMDHLFISFNVYVDLENRKANFTDGKFTEMLNSIKEYEEKGYISSVYANEQAIYYDHSHDWPLLSMISKEPDANYKIGRLTKDEEIIGMFANQNGDVPFILGNGYAINVNSKNKRTAWEFMKFLISEEIQTSPSAFSVVVNKNALVTNAKTTIYNRLTPNRFVYDILPPDAVLAENQQKMLDRYIDYMGDLLPLINSYLNDDYIIRRVIIELEVKKFFDGIRTADEVANILQSRVTMYLQE